MQDANSVSETHRFELDWPVFTLKPARTILTLGGGVGNHLKKTTLTI